MKKKKSGLILITDDFGSRRPVIQKPFLTKSDTAVVARVVFSSAVAYRTKLNEVS